YIGMFQPDPNSYPRWFGNMKRYQLLAAPNGDVTLGDSVGLQAINPLTGFVTSCATSYWTQDTSNYKPSGAATAAPYWSIVPVTPLTSGTCPGASPFSDLPDGPIVEKGAAAQVLRMGNNPGAAPTWNPATRNVLTLAPSGSVTPFTVASTGLAGPL